MTNELVTTNMSGMLERAASNPDVDADKLQKLLDMQLIILDREAKQAFAASMNACQAEMPLIAKNAENQQTSSKYSKHELICKEITPVYTKHGFSISFTEGQSQRENHIQLIGELEHCLGRSKIFTLDIPIDSAGIKGTVNKTPTHASGSTLTYARRYLTLMIFNLATYDDTDANVAPRITAEQIKILEKIIKDNSINKDKFLKYLNVDSLENLAAKAFDHAKNELDHVAKEKKKRINKDIKNDNH